MQIHTSSQSFKTIGFLSVISVVIFVNVHIANGNFSLSCQMLDESLDRAGGIRIWPNGRIPYTLDSSMDDKATSKFQKAIENYHSLTCLTFVPKTSSDYNHIHVRIDPNNPYCGTAHRCLQNIGRQRVDVAPICKYQAVFVHELGHAVCLDHENLRPDRSLYLDFSKCSNPSHIEPIIDLETTRVQIYDYNSAMHTDCYDCAGLPTQPSVTKCGVATYEHGLTTIDADRLNEVYNCQGCFRHRWYRVDKLTSDQEATLVDFAEHIEGHEPVYLCRGLVTAIILPGTYVPSEKSCFVRIWDTNFWVTQDIQVFGLPNGPNAITTTSSGYKLFPPNRDNDDSNLSGTGRDPIGRTVYSAVWQFIDDSGFENVVLGYVYQNGLAGGYFSFKNETKFIWQDPDGPILYHIMGCQL